MAVVGITANRLVDDAVHRDWIRRRYIDALIGYAGVHVVILPTQSQTTDSMLQTLARLDGLVLTGDESNLDPEVLSGIRDKVHGIEYLRDQTDHYRDLLSKEAISTALRCGMPILAICRGLQELNVCLGGTLHSDLHAVPLAINHSEDLSLPRDRQYDPVHRLNLVKGGKLNNLFGRNETRVNSLHTQGIDRLASRLIIEGTSDDGLIEAVRVDSCSAFQIGVQWHPEWHIATDAFSQILFNEFGAACLAYEKDVREKINFPTYPDRRCSLPIG